MMDAPPAICQTVDLARLAPAALAQRRAAARGRMGEMLYFRAGDDLLSFPAAYALSVPDLARFGCLARTREVAFAFRLSDLAPAGEGAPGVAARAGAEAAAAGAAAPAGPRDAAAPAASLDGAKSGAPESGDAKSGDAKSGAPKSATGDPPASTPSAQANPAQGKTAQGKTAPAASDAPRAVAPSSVTPSAAASPAAGSPASAPGSAPHGATPQDAGGEDMIVRVVALYVGRHADFMGMTRAIASVRKEEARRGFVYALERFPTPAGDRLVRISEDRCLILSLPPDPAAPGAVMDMRFQNEDWSAVVEVPAGAAGRWEAVYKGIERFLAAHLVRNAFRK